MKRATFFETVRDSTVYDFADKGADDCTDSIGLVFLLTSPTPHRGFYFNYHKV
jgi:hypothetical protein